MSEEQFLYNSHQDFLEATVIAGRPLVDLIREIQHIYKADSRPWVVGFSGGKDSTVILSLVYAALNILPEGERHKHVYVVSSDTLVETPVVVDMIRNALDSINCQAPKDKIPMTAHAVIPAPDETFWVNLLGKGYPAPTKAFRWCTERMKIDPVSEFIKDKVAKFGEVVVVLGSRRQESSTRAQVIARHRIDGSALGRHSSLPNAYTYMPIEHWSSEEVWEYLMSAPRPWGGSNRVLFELYKGSNAGECPLVIDTNTPSCGSSRFGCWTCTVVTQDKAIEGLVNTGEEWMRPLLDFRNNLHFSSLPENKTEYRNYKRRTGKVTFARGAIDNEDSTTTKHVPGPYWMNYRKSWLKELLHIEKGIRAGGHDIDLIGRDELQVIRQQWLKDPNEPDWLDSLPKIYSEVYPEDHIEWIKNDAGAFTEPDAVILAELERTKGVPAALIMKLIDSELSFSGLSRRKGILDDLQRVLEQDWGGLEAALERHSSPLEQDVYRKEFEVLRREVEGLLQ
ncbi:DNA phosphorothioation system sulfurtransferase DndC [Pseudomonas aeruginosa]|uniref:DNA phosphorothioation system sulfurtransferase DndC n=1 Tax=Pseudomonas TaxID=286 RepID=UPI000694F924|nr:MULTISPECIES: DNA phosphorothioation system sulfurtransferase DndC [Pseudomonas]MBW6388142.1 DNA phosphorothioation system sulfurtransferase DndC [Pseudomonas aeruginosa]MBX5941812.1 DNA phosphorothioation system sulfurtransferase DndC [Pseudomonas aeruginosa]MDI9296809.1 DNA phosphorothioation system sulfurtransferase DndC [Pseudomonas aeruginosa]RQD58836.1 DNA phosphorothioation system sulfurtransferase DndC [Pseudomonas aeruginosa]HCF2623342.1 DNA phosphorothioation system sulfurtransfer